MNELIKNIINPINGLENKIISNADFINGANYGKVRNGHPEGQVIYHIKEVLSNIDNWYSEDNDYENLRIIAILHDTFKYKVNQNLPKIGENHHGMIARRFAENYPISQNVIMIIQHHDDAYNAWQKGGRHGDWYQAKKKAENLINGLLIEGCLDLYMKFYRCDNATGDKSQDNYEWFVELVTRYRAIIELTE